MSLAFSEYLYNSSILNPKPEVFFPFIVLPTGKSAQKINDTVDQIW